MKEIQQNVFQRKKTTLSPCKTVKQMNYQQTNFITSLLVCSIYWMENRKHVHDTQTIIRKVIVLSDFERNLLFTSSWPSTIKIFHEHCAETSNYKIGQATLFCCNKFVQTINTRSYKSTYLFPGLFPFLFQFPIQFCNSFFICWKERILLVIPQILCPF